MTSEDQNDPAKATRFAKTFHPWLLAIMKSPCHAVEAKREITLPKREKGRGGEAPHLRRNVSLQRYQKIRLRSLAE